jgi:pimeloyl-ACP methyl ester carboxylesterase
MSITATSVDKPTVILVHGAFAESSSWKGGIAPLIDDGYPVLAVANPLRGVKSDSDYLHSVLLFLFGTEDKNCPTAAHRFMADGPVPADRGTPGRVACRCHPGGGRGRRPHPRGGHRRCGAVVRP